MEFRSIQTIEQPFIINTDFVTNFRYKLYSLDTYSHCTSSRGRIKTSEWL